MKKIIPFIKDIKFNTKIYEIISISLENTLSLTSNNLISGEFIISGDYKINDSSINTEPFIYGIPFDINLDEKYNLENLKIDIDDFKYEIINEEILKINIDVLLDGLEEKLKEEEIDEITTIEPDLIIEARKNKNDDEVIMEDDNMDLYTDDLFKQNDDEVEMVNKQTVIDDNNVTSIFEKFDSKDEKYVSYYVHIVRENDTIESIMNQYNVELDDLKEYNNIDQITLGNKIIVPYKNETN